MTWRGERRKQLPPDWQRRRRIRLAMDGGQCTAPVRVVDPVTQLELPGRCTALATDVHHANGPDDHRIEALRSLCAWHHRQHTQAEAAQAQGRGPLRLRPKKKHPGLR